MKEVGRRWSSSSNYRWWRADKADWGINGNISQHPRNPLTSKASPMKIIATTEVEPIVWYQTEVCVTMYAKTPPGAFRAFIHINSPHTALTEMSTVNSNSRMVLYMAKNLLLLGEFWLFVRRPRNVIKYMTSSTPSKPKAPRQSIG